MVGRVVADYAVPKISEKDPHPKEDAGDASTALARPELNLAKNFQFNLSDDTEVGLPLILSFTANPIDPDDLVLRIKAGPFPDGDHQIAEYKFNSNETNIRTIHEVFHAGHLMPVPGSSSPNEIDVSFKLTSGDGTVHIGDVVLWFKRRDDH